MNIAWAVTGAVLGALAGGAMRGLLFRFSVAPGQPERTDCERCGARIGGPLARHCAGCSILLGLPLVPELATAAVLALLGARLGGQPLLLLPFGFLGLLGVALSVIDISVQRLPNKLTLPGYPVLIALLALAAFAGHDVRALGGALLGGLALGAGYLLLAIVRPGQLFGGDIKLAGLVGLALGWLGWPAVLLGTGLAYVLCALVSLTLLATRTITLRSSICFGPFMLGGALLMILLSGSRHFG